MTCGVVLLLTGDQEQGSPDDQVATKDLSSLNEEEEQDAGTDSAYSTTGSTATSVHHHNDDAETNDGSSDGQSTSSGTMSPTLTEAGLGCHTESSLEAHLLESGAQDSQGEATVVQACGEDCAEPAGEGQDFAVITPCGHQRVAEGTAEEVYEEENEGRSSDSPIKEEILNPRTLAFDRTHGPSKKTSGGETQPSGVNAPLERELASLETKSDRVNSKPIKSPEKYGTLSLGEQLVEVEKMRSPEQDLPYTLQHYFLADDSASDTLSIISERTEPAESGDATDREEYDTLTSDDSDSEGTVHDDLDGHWSDDCNDVVEYAGTTTPRKLSASDENVELLAFQQQLEARRQQLEPKQAEGSPAFEDHQSTCSNDLQGERDNQENPQLAQQIGELPESAMLEDSSTQTEEAFLVSKDEQKQVQDLLIQADLKAGMLRHILQEDLSAHAEEASSVGKGNQGQVQDLLTEQGKRRPQRVKPFLEDEIQIAASLLDQSYHSDDQSVVLPSPPEKKSGAVVTGAVTDPGPYELEEGQEDKEVEQNSDEFDPAKNCTKASKADSCDSCEYHGEDCSPGLSEKKVSLHDAPGDAETGNMSTVGKDENETDLASSPVDVSFRREAVFLDEEEADDEGCGGISTPGAYGGGGGGEHFTADAGRDAADAETERKMDAVTVDQPENELMADGTNASEKLGNGDAGTDNVSHGADRCLTNMPGSLGVHFANTNTVSEPKPDGGAREDAALGHSGILQKTSFSTGGPHLTGTQTRHDSERKSDGGDTENKFGLQTDLSADRSRRPSFPNEYLPDAEVDLDDPRVFPTPVADMSDSVGGGASAGLASGYGLGARDSEAVSRFSKPRRRSAEGVASSPSCGTTLLSMVLLGGDDFVLCFHYTLLFCFAPWQWFYELSLF